MAAAAPALIASTEVAKLLSSASHELAGWAKQPFYTNMRTKTRAWVEKDKNGKDHWLTETTTHGFSISNGMLLGVFLTFMAWEAALAVATAVSGWFGGSQKDMTAALALASPIVMFYDEANLLVGIGTSAVSQTTSTAVGVVTTIFDWLDGKGATNSTPPPKAHHSSTMPSTVMAALSDLTRGIVSPLSSQAVAFGTKLSDYIQNPPQP